MKTPIECFVCGKRCGWSYSATWHESFGGSPAEDSGDGENFTDREGHWHCGEKCLRQTEEYEAEMIMQDLDLEEREETMEQWAARTLNIPTIVFPAETLMGPIVKKSGA